MMWIIVFIAMLHTTSASSTCRGFLSRSGSCYAPYGSVLDNAIARNVIDCARHCVNTATCRSIWFNTVTRTCITNAGVLNSTIPGCPNTQTYAELSVDPDICYPPIPLLYMSDTCTTNADCTHISQAECRDGTCWCLAGYSFQKQTSSCVTSCPEGYGTSYQQDKNKLIAQYNVETIYDMVSAEACMLACTSRTTFTCIVAKFKSSNGACYLGVETALTQPANYMDGTTYGYSIYQRDCLFT